jgi:hypothetical protein
MYCFCSNELTNDRLGIRSIEFTEFGDENAKNYCETFLEIYARVSTL